MIRKSKKRDVLIHFDEDSNEIVSYTVDSASIDYIREREFDGGRIGVDCLLEKPADEAEKAMGELIYTLIDNFSHKEIGIRDYAARIETAENEYISQLEILVEQGDPEAHYHLSMAQHRIALSKKSIEHLEKSEILYTKSAELGYAEAR